MSLKVAFIGFRHPHIHALYDLLKDFPGVETVAACEEEEAAREGAVARGVALTHTEYTTMLDEVACDVVAVGDYFGLRGARAIEALQRGKHVIADKPLCTRVEELGRIEILAREKRLSLGLMLDLCNSGMLMTVRRLVREGAIGDVQSIVFNGQHPLLYGTRAGWYFEEGKHGGTINDIAIHAIDCVPWIVGHDVVQIDSARSWNAKLKECPHFHDGGVLTLRLANGCSVLGDVSYLIPDKIGYSMPTYWRMGFSGTTGYIETSAVATTVSLYRNDAAEVEEVPFDDGQPGGYFRDFLSEIEGKPNKEGLTTSRVIRSSRIGLLAQQSGETGRYPVPLG